MIAVNLLPWRRARQQRQLRISLVFAALALMILLPGTAWQRWRDARVSQQLQAARHEAREALALIEQQLEQRRALRQQLEQAQAQAQAQQRRERRQADALLRWHRFWLALPTLLPDRLWLQRVEKQPARLRLEGLAQDMRVIREFRQRLAGQPLFAAVAQGEVQRQPDGLYRFALRAQPAEADRE